MWPSCQWVMANLPGLHVGNQWAENRTNQIIQHAGQFVFRPPRWQRPSLIFLPVWLLMRVNV